MTNSIGPDDLQVRIEYARHIKKLYQDLLLEKANVVGVGIGYRKVGGVQTREVALVVMVKNKLPHSELNPEDVIPREIEGLPVDVQEVGELTAQ